MDEEIQELSERVERLLAVTRRLADENRDLRARVTESQHAYDELQQRMSDARARVEAALSRLPLAVNGEG